MGQIEELPDDFDESLDLNKPPIEPIAPTLPPSGLAAITGVSNEVPFPINEDRLKDVHNDPSAPRMPPAMESVKSHTADEILEMMNKTPLFMTDLENAGDEGAYIAVLSYLYSLTVGYMIPR